MLWCSPDRTFEKYVRQGCGREMKNESVGNEKETEEQTELVMNNRADAKDVWNESEQSMENVT